MAAAESASFPQKIVVKFAVAVVKGMTAVTYLLPLWEHLAADVGAAVVVGVPAYAVTPLEGLKERLGEEKVLYAPGPFAERTIPNFLSKFIADFGFESPKPQTWEEQTAGASGEACRRRKTRCAGADRRAPAGRELGTGAH